MYSNQLESLGGILIFIAFLSFLWGVTQCFAGYKVFRFVIVLTGIFLGGTLGYLLAKNGAGVLLGAVAGGMLLWFFYQVGIFIMGMTLGYLLTILVMLLSGNAGYDDIAVFGFLLGIAGGIFALYWHKFVIVLSTAFYGGFIMAFWLGIFFTRSVPEVLQSPGMLIMVTLFLGFLGMLVQYEKLDGFFSGGKNLADLKITSEDIYRERQITPETMEKNMEEFKRIKEVFQNPQKYRNRANAAPQPPVTPTYQEADYQTRRVPAPGTQMASLSFLQLSGNNKQRRYQINWRPVSSGFEALVGKATATNFPEVDIPESVISRKHVLLKQKNSQLFIVHLSATNPTYKNNQPLQPNTEYPLQKGDKLIMGDIHFKVE